MPKHETLKPGFKQHEWEVLDAPLEYSHYGRTLYPVKCSCGRRFLRQRRDLFYHQRCIHCAQKVAGIKRRRLPHVDASQRTRLYSRWWRLKKRKELCEEWFVFSKFLKYVSSLPLCNKTWVALKRIDESKLYEPGNVKFVTPKGNTNESQR